MSADRFVYRAGDRLPGLTLPWDDAEGEPIDFLAVGHTFAATLIPDDGSTNVTVSGSIAGDADGNVTIAWSAGDLTQAVGRYRLKLVATESATSKPRTWSPDALPIIQIVA